MNNDWKTDKADVFPLIVGQVKNNLQVQEGKNQSPTSRTRLLFIFKIIKKGRNSSFSGVFLKV